MGYKRTARIPPTYSSVQHKQSELHNVKLKSTSLIHHALFCYTQAVLWQSHKKCCNCNKCIWYVPFNKWQSGLYKG